MIINLIGLFRANNIAAILSLSAIVVLYLLSYKFNLSLKKLSLIGIVMLPLIVIAGLNIKNISYEGASMSLILEGLRYSNLYENEPDRNLKVERFL